MPRVQRLPCSPVPGVPNLSTPVSCLEASGELQSSVRGHFSQSAGHVRSRSTTDAPASRRRSTLIDGPNASGISFEATVQPQRNMPSSRPQPPTSPTFLYEIACAYTLSNRGPLPGPSWSVRTPSRGCFRRVSTSQNADLNLIP